MAQSKSRSFSHHSVDLPIANCYFTRLGKPPFSHGFSELGFPMVFICFSHGFPMVSHGFPPIFHGNIPWFQRPLTDRPNWKSDSCPPSRGFQIHGHLSAATPRQKRRFCQTQRAAKTCDDSWCVNAYQCYTCMYIYIYMNVNIYIYNWFIYLYTSFLHM